jgi:hypothetical protein
MIDWSKQHCGVLQAEYYEMLQLMPDIDEIINTFPENVDDFIWDVKVHMLMPNQYPCIPNWHFDNIPRVDNKQRFDLIIPEMPMYLWISNGPLTEFRKGDKAWFVEPQTWTRFTQQDEHRGTMSNSFCWRGFIRATHKTIAPPQKCTDKLRRHSQVYLDSNNFKW